jgi:GTP pyrophosphokinase
MPADDVVARAGARFSVNGADGLYQALGHGDLPLGQVIHALFPDREQDELEPPKPTVFGRVLDRLRIRRGVRIQGVDGLLVRYAQCCQPVPGDPVVGYVTQGRGISIHRANCANLLLMSGEPERRVEIDWKEMQGEVFLVRLGVTGEDRQGLYADLLEAVSKTGTNMKSADLSSRDGAMFGTVVVEVENHGHLEKVLRAMRRVKGVSEVERRESAAPGTGET